MKDRDGHLTTLFRLNFRALGRAAARHVGASVAEDVVQDAFLAVWSSDAASETITLAYLRKSVRNRALDEMRRRRRWLNALPRMQTADRVIRGSLADAWDLRAAADDEDVQAWLMRAVARLSERQASIFRLHRYRHLSYADIAAALGISPRTVETHMRRAMRALLERWNEERRDR